jgi:glycosyltransferase involved in cell wall biosynthesis
MLVTHSLATGGTDRVAMYLANGFAQHIDTNLTHILWPSASSPLFEMLDPAVTTCGYFRESRGRTKDMIFSFAKFARTVRRAAPDIMLATGNNNAWYTGLAFAFNPNPNRKLYVKITNPVIRARGGALVNALRRAGYGLLFRQCAGILALSDGEARQLSGAFPQYASKIKVVENPYVTDEMLRIGTAREATSSATSKTVIALGRLHHQKNLPLLLRAWQKLDRNDARLVLVGEGPDKPALEQLAQTLGIAGSVQFAGYQSDITPYLREAHILALSSSYEGLPAVVLEAMAAGCPVVATDCFPAARTLLGMAPLCHLVARDDIDGLAAALNAALSGPRTHADLALSAKPYQIAVAVKSHMQLMNINH